MRKWLAKLIYPQVFKDLADYQEINTKLVLEKVKEERFLK